MVEALEVLAEHKDISKVFTLLNEMNSSVQHVLSLVDSMLQRVRKGELTTDQGLSFLEMKYNMLLSYLINLTYVILRKCSGEKIEGDPCIERLIEIRTILEKIRPINNKLSYQINKLVKAATTGTDGDDPTAFKANPENLMDEERDAESSEASGDDEKKEKINSGVYVPPKFSAVHYPGEEQKIKQKQDKKMSLSASIMQDLKEEYLDTPVEIAQSSRAQQMVSKREQEIQEYEETYFTRLPINKSEKHKRRQLTTLGTLGNEITDFGDNKSTSRKRRSSMKGKAKNYKRRRFH